jgi:hypothetical protein
MVHFFHVGNEKPSLSSQSFSVSSVLPLVVLVSRFEVTRAPSVVFSLNFCSHEFVELGIDEYEDGCPVWFDSLFFIVLLVKSNFSVDKSHGSLSGVEDRQRKTGEA